MPAGRLRVGLFVDSRIQPRSLVEAFADTAIAEHAEIVLIALGNRPGKPVPFAWRALGRLDRWLSKAPMEASTPVDIVATLAPVHVIPMPDRNGRYLLEGWHASITSFRLDVAFLLGEVDDEALHRAARYGVWRFELGAGGHAPSGLEGFAEVADGLALTTAALHCRTPGNREGTLYQTWSRTAPFSLNRNRERLLRRAASLPRRVLQAFRQYGWQAIRAEDMPPAGEAAANAADAVHTRVRRPAQSATRTPAACPSPARGLAGIGWRAVRRAVQKLTGIDQWFIAYRFGDGGAGGDSFGRFSCLMPPQDRFWADPFPVMRDGRHYIFFEEYLFAAGKAHLAYIEVRRDGSCSAPEPFLERPFHLSYPFLFEDGGQLFMVPETGEHGTVELFRCVRFPDRWVREKILLRMPHCVDATLHRVDGRWWMFVAVGSDDPDVHDELHLYHADSIRGQWTPHRANPVKSDVRSARPAGHLYEFGGHLYRPSQIGAPLYGSGISINQIIALTPDEYREREVGRILPPDLPGVLGVHTVNRAGDLIVVDGFARRRRLLPGRLDVFEPRYLRSGGGAT